MKTFGMKAGLFAALISLGVLLGIEIATSGLERVHGPIPATAVSAPPDLPASAPRIATPPQNPPSPPSPPPPIRTQGVGSGQHTFVNHLAIKTGEALRWSAQRIIRWSAILFDEILH